jgi:hypothetical protein
MEDQTVPQQAAPDVSGWRTVGRVDAPFDTTAGPILDGFDVQRCYARTPVGALLAATNFMARVTEPVALEQAISALTADTAGQDVLLGLLEENPTAVTGSGAGYELAGYTFLAVGMDTTVVSVVVRAGNGGMVAVPVTLVWDEGTWLVQLPDNGNLPGSPVQTLTGFVPWSAG